MILLMGIAGSGKGTQGKMLADQYNYHLFSMGEILRMYLTGEQRQRIVAGNLLGDDETIKIVDKLLNDIPDEEGIILDGFPRTIPQAKWLIEQSKSGRFKLKVALHLVASKRAVKDRLIKRARLDDNEDAIEKRFSEYDKSTMPLVRWLDEHGVKVVNIEAEHSIEEVNKQIRDALKNV
ncbi:MAG TPA: nucleoside monophosphate kinase [Candidatus Sulfotelmatobacter sp.]|nr:nucleoside monophosphate kinase [Candidatus Sulfotelmatobacter sp.]